MFNKPHDIVWIFAIAGLVIITFMFGIQSVIFSTDANPGSSMSFFHDFNESLTQGKGANTTTAVTLSLVGQDSEEEATQEGFITRGFKSMVAIGDTFSAISGAMSDSSAILGIDPTYYLVILGALAVTFFIVLYTWIRGS